MLVRQRKINAVWYHLYVESKIGYKWPYLQNRNRLTDIKNRYEDAKEGGEGNGLGVWA